MSKEYEGMGLTAEELAALSAPDDEDTTATQEELEAKAAAEGAATIKDDTNADTTTQDAGGDGAGAAADDAVPAAAAAGAEHAVEPVKPAAEPAATTGTAPQQAPILVAKAPDDAEAKLKQISENKAELRQKYDDGELTFAEYEDQKEKLDEQRMDIRLAVEKANTAEQMDLQQKQNQWNADCGAFMEQHKALYDGEANAAAFADLDAAIKAIAVMPSSANLTGPQLLDRAHRAVMAAHGKPVVDAKDDAKPAPRKEIPKPALPPDLGKMPAATGNDPGEGKWASLDRMQDTAPEAYEAALAKLSEADREAYLSA